MLFAKVILFRLQCINIWSLCFKIYFPLLCFVQHDWLIIDLLIAWLIEWLIDWLGFNVVFNTVRPYTTTPTKLTYHWAVENKDWINLHNESTKTKLVLQWYTSQKKKDLFQLAKYNLTIILLKSYWLTERESAKMAKPPNIAGISSYCLLDKTVFELLPELTCGPFSNMV